MTTSVLLNFLNVKNDVLSLNPTDKPNQKSIHLIYPSAEPEMFWVLNRSNQNSPQTLAFNITLQYQGILTEKTKVNVTTVGVVHNLAPIEFVMVGFEHANPTNGEIFMPNLYYTSSIDRNRPENKNLPPDKVLINDPSLNNHDTDGTYVETIYWDEQGDYSPFITIYYENETHETILYPTQQIQVISPDIILQERYARTNTWISIALFVFTIVTILPIMSNLLPKRYLSRFISFDENTDREHKGAKKKRHNLYKNKIQQILLKHKYHQLKCQTIKEQRVSR